MVALEEGMKGRRGNSAREVDVGFQPPAVDPLLLNLFLTGGVNRGWMILLRGSAFLLLMYYTSRILCLFLNSGTNLHLLAV